MNLTRLIKLKKINGELDNLTEQESYFLSLFDGLNIQYNNNDIDLIKNDVVYFRISLKNKKIYYSYVKIWLVFESKYDTSILKFNNFVCNILETHLNLTEFTSAFCYSKPFK